MDKIINEIKGDLIKNLLPELNLFKEFEVGKIHQNSNYLGCYQIGSCEMPIIKLNISEIKRCISDKTSLDLIIATTILHELGHAIQEYKNKWFDEIEAENFAYDYYYYKKILKI